MYKYIVISEERATLEKKLNILAGDNIKFTIEGMTTIRLAEGAKHTVIIKIEL